MRSDQINELASALAKAQVGFKPIKKNRTAKIFSPKGSYEYQYADLADIIEAVTPSLSLNGLSVVQPVEIDDAGGSVATHLVHESGQYIVSSCRFALGDRMQETGARITYLRRYALSGMLGVASEDDTDLSDSATEKNQKAVKPDVPVTPQKSIVGDPGKSTPVLKVDPSHASKAIPPKDTPSAEHTRLRVLEAAKKAGWNPESVTRFIDAAYGVKLVRDLTPEQVEFVLATISTRSTIDAMADLGKSQLSAVESFDFGANHPETRMK